MSTIDRAQSGTKMSKRVVIVVWGAPQLLATSSFIFVTTGVFVVVINGNNAQMESMVVNHVKFHPPEVLEHEQKGLWTHQ